MREAELPKTNSPSLFRSADSINTNIESLPYLAWWQQFNDPTLNNLIESSILNNLELQSSIQSLEQARGQLLQAKLSCGLVRWLLDQSSIWRYWNIFWGLANLYS